MSKILRLYLLFTLAACFSSYGQTDFLTVTVQPENTDWHWEDYSLPLAGRLIKAIEERVREGIPKREFTFDTSAVLISFNFRIDPQGRLEYFKPLSPHHRYTAYLIERTAWEIGFATPLPEDFPFFYFDGTMTFRCRMRPTGFYKRHYFEEPLDSLPEVPFEPIIRKVKVENSLVLYEPEIADKKKLLEDFKQRIGMVPEFSDTSSYTPLEVKGMTFAVRVAFDSLTSDPVEKVLLKGRIERALEVAGAIITQDTTGTAELADKPPEPPAVSAAAPAATSHRDSLATDSSLAVHDSLATPESLTAPETPALQDTTPANQDSLEPGAQPVGRDSLARKDSAAVQAIPAAEISRQTPDSLAKKDSLVVEKAAPMVPGEVTRPVPPERDLSMAFNEIFSPSFLVLSTGLAADTTRDTAICRIKLFPAGKPGELKRRVNYKFASKGLLPDSLGKMLVTRLTSPPPKPQPPKPAEKIAPKAAAGDTTAKPVTGAPTATAAGAKADSTAVPAVPAKTDSTAAPPGSSPVADTTGAASPAADISGAQPAPAPAVLPADSGATEPAVPAPAADTSAAPQQAPPAAAPAPEACRDSVSAAPDSAKGGDKK